MSELNEKLLDVILTSDEFEEIALNMSSEYLTELVKILELDIQNSLVSRLDNIRKDLVDSF